MPVDSSNLRRDDSNPEYSRLWIDLAFLIDSVCKYQRTRQQPNISHARSGVSVDLENTPSPHQCPVLTTSILTHRGDDGFATILKSPLNMLKKASIISSYSCLQSCSCPHPAASNTSPSCLPPLRARPAVRQCRPSRWRTYADVHQRNGSDFRDNMHWPASKTPSTAPTPYEIFELPKRGTYSKHRFYELVKIYHPDRHGMEGTACGGISYVEKLERYRLIVLAHEILSDPVKRRAYDSHGAGWGSHEKQSTRHTRGYYSASAGKPFGFGQGYDNSPFGNATWEDWERWYRRSEPNHQQAYAGNYINPNAFASFVILMAVITGVAQATKAGQYSGKLEEKVNAFTEETSRFLASRATEYNENKLTSDGRIKHFLEKRDPSKYGLKDEEEETYRKHFNPQAPPTAKDQRKLVPPE